jgi:hypothetical protein
VKFGERGKRFGWQWRAMGCSRGLTRVLTKPWPLVDQGVSLGIVGDVFEVMAQVDHRLTKVNAVDRFVRVNKPDWKPWASQSSKENFWIPWEDGRRWLNLQKRSPIRSSRRLAPLTINLQRGKLIHGLNSSFHGGRVRGERGHGLQKGSSALVWWGWSGDG